MKNSAASLFLFIMLILPYQRAFAGSFALSGNDVYIRNGFSQQWTAELPDSSDWLSVATEREKLYRIRFRNCIDRNESASFRESALRTFTCVIPFHFPYTVNRNIPYALRIPDIGRNWEIYLNGKIIKSGMPKKAESRSLIPFRRIGMTVFIPADSLLHGNNILSFRIDGDPNSEDTGLSINSRFVIDDMSALQSDFTGIMQIALISLYLFIGLYHLFLYSRRVIDIHYMFFGLFSVLLSMYLFARSSYMYDLIVNSITIWRLEHCILYLLIPVVAAFFDRLHHQRLSRLTRLYSGFILVLIFATILLPPHLLTYIVSVWRFSAIAMLSYILVDGIIGHFISELRRIRLEFLNETIFPSYPALFSRLFSTSNAGYLFIGAGLTFVCAVFDILDSAYLHTEIHAMNYGFLVFTTGMTFGLAKRFQGFYSEIEHLNNSLKKSIAEVREANRSCAISEERYRLIIEKSKDIIFTLDHDFNIISVNMAIQNVLNIDPDEVTGKNFFELIRINTDSVSTSMDFLESQFEKISSTLEPVQFKVNLKTRFASETVEILITLEHITGAGGNEFVGKASTVTGDSLLRLVEKEYQQYRIGNFITTAEEVTHRITENLIRYMDQQKVLFLRVALREIIINSIEHGNLGITFEEKTAAMREGRYINLISERQNDPEYSDRKIEISYTLTGKMVRYRITDEGKGFDYNSALDGDMSNEANEYALTHGRGIIIAKNIFDRISFRNNGSSVELIKYLNDAAAVSVPDTNRDES